MKIPGAKSKLFSILYQVVAYIFVLQLLRKLDPVLSFDSLWLRLFTLDAIGTLAIFGIGIVLRNASLYDPYWSVAPPVIAVYLVKYYGLTDLTIRQWIVLGLIFFWGIRLTVNFFYGWLNLEHEDWRYRQLREKHGKLFQLINLGGIHLFPTILVFMACLPMISVFGSNAVPFGFIDGIGVLICAIALFFETVSDIQLHRFVSRKNSPVDILQTGLWSICRHPNYFGELFFWWGIACFGLSVGGFLWWHWIGALSITLLFFFVSVPLIERRMLERRPFYAEVQKRISVILPWFPKK